MKVVLFCGGLGLRLGSHSQSLPKPMVTIGDRPILWHVMKYYAHFGHREFLLCLGSRADVIKSYFLNYEEWISNDFVLSSGGKKIDVLSHDIVDWKITFVDTGVSSNVGQRLRAVEPHLEGEDSFLANYTDGLTDLHLPDLIEFHRERQPVASFLAVRPTQTFHTVSFVPDGHVEAVRAVADTDTWINGGFFIFQRDIFRYIRDGEELVEEPFARLAAERRLCSLRHPGFWGCMDTYKEKQRLDDMYARGDAPWEVWAATDRQGVRALSHGACAKRGSGAR